MVYQCKRENIYSDGTKSMFTTRYTVLGYAMCEYNAFVAVFRKNKSYFCNEAFIGDKCVFSARKEDLEYKITLEVLK